MSETREDGIAKDLNHKLRHALNGFIFEPSQEMLEKRFVDRVAEVIGMHVHELAKEHLKVSRVQDEIILELGKPLMDIVLSVYGADIVSILAPNAAITLPGWRKPERCGSLSEQEQTVSVPLPDIVEEQPEPKAVRTRPRSRRIWQGD
jgi:hypothetical protein